MSLSQILQAVDSDVNKHTPEGTAATISPQPTAASQELIEFLRAENNALRGQLSQELRKENAALKEKLRESPSTTLLAPEPQPQCQQSKILF